MPPASWPISLNQRARQLAVAKLGRHPSVQDLRGARDLQAAHILAASRGHGLKELIVIQPTRFRSFEPALHALRTVRRAVWKAHPWGAWQVVGRYRACSFMALLAWSSATQAVMSPAECANLQKMLSQGPSFRGLAHTVDEQAAMHELRKLTGWVAPFERCVVTDSIAGVSLGCSIEIEMNGVAKLDSEGVAELRGELHRMAKDVVGCLGVKLPAADPHKPSPSEAASVQQFGWTFTAPQPAGSEGLVVGATLSGSLPVPGVPQRPHVSLRFGGVFEIIKRAESANWLAEERRRLVAQEPPAEQRVVGGATAPPAPAPTRKSDMDLLTRAFGLRQGDTLEKAIQLLGAVGTLSIPEDSSLHFASWFDGGLSLGFDPATRRIKTVAVEDAAAATKMRQAGLAVDFPFNLLGGTVSDLAAAFGPPDQKRNFFVRWRYPHAQVHIFRAFCMDDQNCKNFSLTWR
jgi:hypothetical protein